MITPCCASCVLGASILPKQRRCSRRCWSGGKKLARTPSERYWLPLVPPLLSLFLFFLAMETYNNVSLSDGFWLLRACTDVACFVHCIDVELDWTSSCDGGRRSSFQRRRQFEISIHTFIIRRTSLGDLFTLNG